MLRMAAISELFFPRDMIYFFSESMSHPDMIPKLETLKTRGETRDSLGYYFTLRLSLALFQFVSQRHNKFRQEVLLENAAFPRCWDVI